MKKNIIIGVAFFVITLGDLLAQNNVTISASVTKSFEEAFQGATQIQWESCSNKLYLAKFHYLDKFCLAYYDHSGNLVTSGRKINGINDLPIQVQHGLFQAKQRSERKFGAVSVGGIYEMVKDGITEYFVPMQNASIYLLFSIGSEGSAVLKKKKTLNVQPKPKNVLAKKN